MFLQSVLSYKPEARPSILIPVIQEQVLVKSLSLKAILICYLGSNRVHFSYLIYEKEKATNEICMILQL